MRLSSIFSSGLLLSALVPRVHGIEARFIREPDIHGVRIVFVLEHDLWLVSTSGGRAERITSHPGDESCPKFSPDGGWIAFTASYDGGTDVYVIPSTGGEPRRLTFHPEPDEVVEWTPDGGSILFHSPRAVQREAYTVPQGGGYQTAFPVDFVRHAGFSPDGVRFAFTRTDADRMHWRGYKGGDQPDIWIGDLRIKTYERLTNYRGYDICPMWHRDAVYFLSDRDGRMNLYSIGLDDRKTIRRTSHSEWDAEEASIGGDRIVYTCGGGLWVYDIPMDRAAPVVVDVPTDRWQMRATYVDPGEFVQDITLSKDGKTAAVQARGDLYLIDENRAVNLTDAPESHEIHPAFSPDGKWVAFFSDRDGDNDLYIAPAGGGAWTRLTRGFRAWPYRLLWSPDSRNLCFGDNRYTLYWIGIDRKDLITVDRTRYQKDNEIYWEVSEYDWSPDSKWIAYSKCEANMNSSIFLYGLEERRTVRVTDDRYDDSWPAFDRNGDLLYFLSLRNFEPFLDPFMDNHINANMSVLMAVQLKKDRPPPFKGGSVAGDEDSGEPDESGKEAPEGGRDAVFRIDTAGLGERLFAAPVPAGTYSRLLAGTDGCFFLSREAFGFPDWFEFIRPRSVTHFSLLRFSEKTRRIEEIIHGIGHYNVSGDGSKIAYLSGGVSGVVSPHGERAPGEGSLDWHSLRQRVDAAEEFRQIYRTVCRQVHDFFYDPDMHGVDWDAVRRKHEALIRFASDRSDLNRLIGWTLAELGVSHSYILDAGDESRAPEDRNVGVGLLGADLEPDPRSGRFRFAHVVHGRNWDASARNPLEAPDVHVKPGEYLLALDGRPLEPGEDVFARLVDKAGKYVKLTVSGNPDTVGARTIEIETLYSERELRRSEWVETNYRKVREATSGRVGYIHLSDMDEQGFQEFEQGFRAERYRDALILDVRGNTGGFISWFLLDKLERRPVFGTQTRDFEPMRYPHGTHPGPLVILCDQNTGSDGEVFVELIKKQNLGTVIGTETWGGLVGINNTIPAADGALVTQPNVGFFDPEGSWIVENRGAVPDVILENGPGDATAGRDPQLEKAIAVSLDLLNRTPAPEFKAPKFPSVP